MVMITFQMLHIDLEPPLTAWRSWEFLYPSVSLIFGNGSFYTAQVDLKLKILSPQPPEYRQLFSCDEVLNVVQIRSQRLLPGPLKLWPLRYHFSRRLQCLLKSISSDGQQILMNTRCLEMTKKGKMSVFVDFLGWDCALCFQPLPWT